MFNLKINTHNWFPSTNMGQSEMFWYCLNCGISVSKDNMNKFDELHDRFSKDPNLLSDEEKQMLENASCDPW